jgi:hypothetical protein
MAGCASFSRDLPELTYEDVAALGLKPAIKYEAVFVELGTPTGRELSTPSSGLDMLRGRIEYVFRESKFFSQIAAETGSQIPLVNLMLLRKKDNDPSRQAPSAQNYLYEFISGITLIVVPYKYRETEYVLVAEVVKNEKQMKRYEYKRSMDSWIQNPFLILLALTHSFTQVEKRIVDNMLRNFLYDLQKDRLLENAP